MLSKKTYCERILVVFNEDGSIKGIHQEDLTVIKDDETVISAKQEAATSIDLATLKAKLQAQ